MTPWQVLFLIGTVALVALPFTSGFYSKEAILAAALADHHGGYLLWLGGVAGAFMTALYSFRLYFLVFYGKKTSDGHEVMGLHLQGPLVVLAILALVGGLIHIPVESVFPHAEHESHPSLFYQAIMIGLPIVGIFCAYLIFIKQKIDTEKLTSGGIGKALHRFWFTQWGMDWLYEKVFVNPYVGMAKLNKKDFIDSIYNGTARLAQIFHGLVAETQTGQIRWYAISLTCGVLLLVSIGVLL